MTDFEIKCDIYVHIRHSGLSLLLSSLPVAAEKFSGWPR